MKNQKGFSAVEGLLILVIVGLLSFVGWYIWDTGKKTEKSLDKASATQANNSNKETTTPAETIDETKNWLLCEPQDSTFSIRFADGWELVRLGGGSSIYSFKELEYKPGIKAVIKEMEGGRGGPFPLSLYFDEKSREYVQPRGEKIGVFRTRGGIVGQKYMYIQESENIGHDLDQGDKEFSYYFEQGDKALVIKYAEFKNQKTRLETVEKVVSTLDFE